MITEVEKLSELCQREPFFETHTSENLLKYYERFCDENKKQNLSRLVDPEAFFRGHVLDVIALIESGFIGEKNLDLGSGGGVPGLLSALLQEDSWVLLDSEIRKVEFLKSTIEELNAWKVNAIWGRVENEISKLGVDTIVSRAVGKITKIYPWVKKCSTWNTIVLFKAKGWSLEWEDFQKSKYRDELFIERIFNYTVPSDDTPLERKLVCLRRK